METKNHDVAIAYVVAGILLTITGWLYADYFNPPWKRYQSGFREVVTQRFGADRARQIPSGIQQIWVQDLNRADRCVTCHLGIDYETLEAAPNPYRSHPKDILRNHPIAKYGCTACHGGDGFATDVKSAHATFADHWEEPLLYRELGKAYQIADPSQLIEINCNVCHRRDIQTEGMEAINYAKQLVEQKHCATCHKINGDGGTIGPDLSGVGDRSPEHFDYSHLQGKQSVFSWHLAHFKNPKSVNPETTMPNFNFDNHDIFALTMLMMSWRRSSLPLVYLPPSRPTLPPVSAESQRHLDR